MQNIDVKSAKGEIRRLNGLMSSTGTNNLTSDLEHLHKQVRDLDEFIVNFTCKPTTYVVSSVFFYQDRFIL